jgi:hypothetical protein
MQGVPQKMRPSFGEAGRSRQVWGDQGSDRASRSRWYRKLRPVTLAVEMDPGPIMVTRQAEYLPVRQPGRDPPPIAHRVYASFGRGAA